MRKNSLPFLICVVSVLAYGILTPTVLAQIPPLSFHPTTNITSEPEYPAPFEDVALTLESASVNTHSVPISWYVNGTLQKQGVGENTFHFKMGASGEAYVIKADANDPTWGLVSSSIALTAGKVDIIWEAKTYTPPFYKGKALPTSRSNTKFVGIPNIGQASSPSAYTYTWYRDYVRVYADSGYGRRSTTLESSYKNHSNTIKIVATNAAGASVSGSITVPITVPRIVFYPKGPKGDTLYNEAISKRFKWKGEELKVVAEPYFFTFPDKNDNSGTYKWEVNGKDTNPDEKSTLFLKFPKNQSGQASFSLRIRNADRLLQTAEDAVILSF